MVLWRTPVRPNGWGRCKRRNMYFRRKMGHTGRIKQALFESLSFKMGATLSLCGRVIPDDLVRLCLDGLGRDAVSLCRVSGSCKRFRPLVEQTAQKRCVELGRGRTDGRSWRQVLGHLSRGAKSELHLTGHKSEVSCVAVLGDGRIVSGSNDASLRVWSSATGHCDLHLTGHTGPVGCVAVLGDGRIVSGSNDGSLRVFM